MPASHVHRGVVVALIPPLGRLEARRPAAWLGLLAGACVAASGDPFVAAAMAALAAVAAIGEIPESGRRSIDTTLHAVRTAWPLVGLAVGHGLVTVCGHPPAGGWVAAAVVVATAVTHRLVQAGQGAPADGSSLTLLIAAAAVMLSRHAVPPGVVPLAAGAAAWFVATGCAVGLTRWNAATRQGVRPLPRTAGVTLSGGILPAGGPRRRLLNALAMGTMLVAMVAWLVLEPRRAPLAVELGLAWFVCLGVPLALLQDGGGVREGSRALWRSASRGLGRRASPGLNPLRFASGVALGHATVLAWPSLVAAAVGLAAPAGVWPGLAGAFVIFAAAATLIALAVVCFGAGASGDTAHAVAILLVNAALGVAVWWAASRPPEPLAHPAPSATFLPGGGKPMLSNLPLPARLATSCRP